MPAPGLFENWRLKNLMLRRRWPWHGLFWIGYVLFRFWPYYITVTYYKNIFLEFMLISDLMFVVMTYLTLALYRRLFMRGKYLIYFSIGTVAWIFFLYARTEFQFFYLQHERGFQNNSFIDIIINNIPVIIAGFLFMTACKYFKDGYISEQFESEKKQQQLIAEVNNLKSQIAPHFLFNTLNNLYGLAVEKSSKLPDLMLRLSDLLRHSLYETQKPFVPLREEVDSLKSYVELESIRLEDNLKLQFRDSIPADTPYGIAPLILIVFIENAFKHARLVQPTAIEIYISISVDNDQLHMSVKNNYNEKGSHSSSGIGLTNVRRRLEVLYPGAAHKLSIDRDRNYYTVDLYLELAKTV